MLSFANSLKVYIAVGVTDLRKGFVGLYAVTQNELKSDPQSGALFVFCNRRRNRVKILNWDGTGLWVMTKRLESSSCGLATGSHSLTTGCISTGRVRRGIR